MIVSIRAPAGRCSPRLVASTLLLARTNADAAREARHQVATAEAAMAEVLAFVPPGEDMVPYEALRTDRGRAVYDKQPGRFYQGRIEVVRDTYRKIVAEFDAETH